jgi:uncharacterized protein YdhG (YjbR/CyaY superfamily)
MAKFGSLEELYVSLPDDQRLAMQNLVLKTAQAFPNLELVLAWNQPMFKLADKYILGFMPTKKHINLLTVSDTAITKLGDDLVGYRHGTRSISLPFDWEFEKSLLEKVLQLRIEELEITNK